MTLGELNNNVELGMRYIAALHKIGDATSTALLDYDTAPGLDDDTIDTLRKTIAAQLQAIDCENVPIIVDLDLKSAVEKVENIVNNYDGLRYHADSLLRSAANMYAHIKHFVAETASVNYEKIANTAIVQFYTFLRKDEYQDYIVYGV